MKQTNKLDPALQSWLHTQLFEQVPCIIAIIDREFNIIEHNKNFQQLFGPGPGRLCYEAYKKKSPPCSPGAGQTEKTRFHLPGPGHAPQERNPFLL